MSSSGAAAEGLALAYLQRCGLTLEAQNYRCRQGEIDLIMRDGATLVFVEVRLRRSRAFGGAGASITREKQRRLVAAAQHYLTHCPGSPACRFDVVLLGGLEPDRLEWIKNAFDAT